MKVWALFYIADVYKSNSSDMRVCYGEKPSAEVLMRESFTKWEAGQLLKGNSVDRKHSSYYLEEIDDYETNIKSCKGSSHTSSRKS